MMKYELGIMSNKWECEAENADIAVVSLRLKFGITVPVAIYTPNEISSFTMPGGSEDLEAFIINNKEEIKACAKTIKET